MQPSRLQWTHSVPLLTSGWPAVLLHHNDVCHLLSLDQFCLLLAVFELHSCICTQFKQQIQYVAAVMAVCYIINI